MPSTTFRLAHLGDERLLQTFLARHADSSLYLRFFLAQGGIVDEGKPLQGTYAVALVDGNVVGVAMHNWQGGVFLQAPDCSAELSRMVVEHTRRPLIALLGPWSQVETAHAGLGGRPIQRQSREGLFALDLSDLLHPPPVPGNVTCRRAEHRDLEFLLEWRFQYEMESTGLPDTDSTRTFAAEAIEGHVDRGEAFLLEVNGERASLCTQNARVSGAVQIGGVWTPKELRALGYGRRVVAGSLKDAGRDGVTRAVLFTENPAARRSYEALGFRQIGEYGITIYST
jgi:GNAT superfamily N-acetyltransferase